MEASDLIGMAQISLRGGMKTGIKDQDPHMEREMKMEDLGDSIRTKVLEVEIIKEMAAIALEAL